MAESRTSSPSKSLAPEETTRLLSLAVGGDSDASRQLMPLVYDQLRALAGSYFRAQPADHTLQPTALVHEAFLKLVQPGDRGWESRAHFMAVAATAMRQILTDRARRRRAAKRAGTVRQVTLEAVDSATGPKQVDIAALDEALTRLGELNARHARIVELRFFAGLTVEETAHVLEISKGSVENDWRVIRAWLRSALDGGEV
jgi:RNA polymerase sigma-70 factor (ECF subfamily)